ncbi:MAG: HAD-IIIA family hydrolase [Balneolales bacterium]
MKAFFLDRDGTVNEDYNFVHSPGQWTWCKGAIDAIRWMNRHQFKVIVVTNQSGVVRGRYTLEEVRRLHRWVDHQLKDHDARVDDWLTAPWHPDFHEGRDPALLKDRKPEIGMFEKARAKYGIDYRQSLMAGDKVSDLIPAVRLGITPFMIRSRFWDQQDHAWVCDNNIEVFDDLGAVVNRLEKDKRNPNS